MDLITIENARGESVSVLTYGAHLQSIRVLDKEGKLGEVILGLDEVRQYEADDNGHMGGTIGRYGNRIAGAQFMLDNVVYRLFANDGPNTLHGGRAGFDKAPVGLSWGRTASVRYTSPHMEEGFPGELKVSVRFSFDDDANLRIDYEAVSDRDTQLNLTNHAYFNLGHTADVRDHLLKIKADQVIEADKALIPTGRFFPVEGTVFDLRTPKVLREQFARKDNDMFVNAKGYDIGFVCGGEGLREIAASGAGQLTG